MKKITIVFILVCFSFLIFAPLKAAENEIFRAEVLDVISQKEIRLESGKLQVQQELLFFGLSGNWLGKQFKYSDIEDLEVLSKQRYSKGDIVLVNYSKADDGADTFLLIDKVRTIPLFWLTLIFVFILIIVGGWKGLKALLSLVLTGFIIIFVIVPLISRGYDPIFVTLLGSFILILLAIYITEGWNKKAHLASLGMAMGIFFTSIISYVFVKWSSLTGTATEEIMYLNGSTAINNFQGLLLAGIILGTIGVLDDLIISQIATVEQIKKANPHMKVPEIFFSASKVGVSHLASMTNTLFLAYAGAALPLLLLFSLKQEPFISFFDVVNSELIATEIVRTFIGVIGLLMAMPIATILAAKYLNIQQND